MKRPLPRRNSPRRPSRALATLPGPFLPVLVVFLALGATAGAQPLQFAHWPLDAPFDDGVIVPRGATTIDDLFGDYRFDWSPGFPEVVAGKWGTAVALDGVADELRASPTIQLPEAGTLGHWLRPEGIGNQIAFYVSDSPDSDLEYNGFGNISDALEIHTGILEGRWVFHYQDGDGSTLNGGGGYRLLGPAVHPDRWTHVAVTWERPGAGDDGIVLYVDCEEVARVSLADAVFASRTSTETYFGRPSEAVRFWNGAVDEIRLFEGAMPQEVIQEAFCPRQIPQSQRLAPPASMSSPGFVPLATDGELLVVGVPDEGAWISQRASDGSWQAGEALPLPVSADDAAGTAVALGGGRIAVGAPETPFGPGVGRVWLLRDDGGDWVVDQTLVPAGSPAAAFGADLAMSSEWLAVLGPDHDGDTGRVWLYRRSGENWSFFDVLDPPAGETFAHEVSLDGSTLGVLERFDGTRVVVHFYEFVEAGWQFQVTVTVEDPSLVPSLRPSLDVSGSRAAVGIPGSRLLGGGSVALLERPGGPDSWVESEAFWPVDVDPGDNFGISVDLDGDHLLVQDWFFPIPGVNDTRLGHVYSWDGETWRPRSRVSVASGTPPARGKLSPTAILHGAEVLSAGSDLIGDGPLFVFSLPLFEDGFERGDTSAW